MPSSSSIDPFANLLAEADASAARDPFTNPHLLFALTTTQRMASGALPLAEVDAAISALTTDAFVARAERLGAYLDCCGPKEADRLTALFERQAAKGFDAYAALLAHPAVGVVTTAHPTFALDEVLSLALVELATGQTEGGEPLDEAGRAERIDLASRRRHRPPTDISLDLEHQWSVRALTHLVDGLDEARRAALAVARRRWPDRWRGLHPRLMTVATWVGFDQDGRTDVTWDVSIGKRLALKQAALSRYLTLARRASVDEVSAQLEGALAAVQRQMSALAGLDPEDFTAVAAFSRVLVAETREAVVDPGPLIAAIDRALAATEDDDCAAALILLRTGLEVQGLCLAHIHVRLNAAQLHNAIRSKLGLETSPSDPANRRSYFQAINGLIESCQPVETGLRDLLVEPSSSKQLFMTIAEMARHIDAASPVRFLIAETESGFTLLVALYFARLYGVEHLVEISPLFETAEALIRGEAVLEEALKSPSYRAGLVAQGRLAVEFGFSDSGRFIGQLAATFRIERLRLRLAELLEREGLCDLKLILFNTHGESMGRGGHPASLADRLAYVAPPQDRREFAKRGIQVREEDSFQGGEGYLPLFTLPAARATVRGLLAFSLDGMQETDDPIYAEPDFASEFFATIQQAFSVLIADPDYAALLSLYGARTLPKTGSRPDQRQSEGAGRVTEFKDVSQLRAIPNNSILQGLAALANLIFGVGRAAAKNPALFETLHRTSPRFRRALDMAARAAAMSDLQATRAYGATLNPTLWLDRRDVEGADAKALGLLTRLTQKAGLTEPLSRVLRRLRVERPLPPALAPDDTPSRRRVRLLHALRVSLIQRAALLAARVPPFTPQAGVTREGIQLRLMRLDVVAAVRDLAEQFPLRLSESLDDLDFGEGPQTPASEVSGYAREHALLLEPLMKLHELILDTTAALNHEIGACG